MTSQDLIVCSFYTPYDYYSSLVEFRLILPVKVFVASSLAMVK